MATLPRGLDQIEEVHKQGQVGIRVGDNGVSDGAQPNATACVKLVLAVVLTLARLDALPAVFNVRIFPAQNPCHGAILAATREWVHLKGDEFRGIGSSH